MARSFKDAYLEGRLESFHQLSAYDVAGARRQQRSTDRVQLADKLQHYAETLAAPKEVFTALDMLRHPASRAVVTGQQAGLLLGPNYSLSKAITALKVAQQCHSDDAPVVAIFWLASQDHDSDEINHAYLLDLQEQLHRLDTPLPDSVPSGRIPLEASWLEQLIHDIEAISGQAAYQADYRAGYGNDIIGLLRDAASVATSFADFFAALLYRLLGNKGLIIINPLDEAIAPLFADILRAELERPLESSQHINHAGIALEKQGYSPQLTRGDAATNLFLEHDGIRELLRFEAGQYYLDSGATFSLNELHDILAHHPSAITPAAGLRPITQDAVLPTLATVVGPGELRYISQLRGVYELHNVPMSLLIPRMTVTVLEAPVTRILKKYQQDYGVTLPQILHDIQQVEADILLQRSGHAALFAQSLANLEESSQRLLEEIRQIDSTLENPVKKTESHIKAKLERLRSKSAQALRTHDTITRAQFQRLAMHLLPLDTPQERCISPFSFFLKFGREAVMEALWALEFDNTDWKANDRLVTM